MENKNLLRINIFLTLLLSNVSVILAQQQSKKQYDAILEKAHKNIERNYHISQSADSKYYEFFDVKYYEYVFQRNNFDMYYSVDAEGITHRIYIKEINNQMPGEFYCKKARLLNIKKTETAMVPFEITDKLLHEAKFIRKSEKKDTIINTKGNNLVSGMSNIIHKTLNNKRYSTIFPNTSHIRSSKVCRRPSMLLINEKHEYEINDTIIDDKIHFHIKDNFLYEYKFSKAKVTLSSKSLSQAEINKLIDEEKRIIGEWDSFNESGYTEYIINSKDYGIIFYDEYTEYVNKKGAKFFSDTKYHFKKIDKYYYEVFRENYFPLYERNVYCGFNKDNLYAYVYKKSTINKGIKSEEDLKKQGKFELIKQKEYSDFCQPVFSMEGELKAIWDNFKKNFH
ncbi:MAG: hypothetical protein LBS69_05890 [Prevotellaceae bacterium]|jgi:hypothetical protein|nr:hypothetical protein [Prevotellaceae bacterium]